MKRLTTILLTLAICVGVFAPAAIAFNERGAVSVGVLTAHAQAATTDPTTSTIPGTGIQYTPGGGNAGGSSTGTGGAATGGSSTGGSSTGGAATGGAAAGGSAATTDATVPLKADPASNIGTCGVGLFGAGSFGSCVAWVVYYIPYELGDWFMSISARAFDVAASFTLSSKLYTSGTFLQQGWQVTRDFANIFFILILLFIALSLVLDIEIGHANPKKMLTTLVMVALVINFSFFITEVVIDISNSLALVFYNQVTVIAKSTNGTQITNSDGPFNAQLQSAQGTDASGHTVQYIQNEKPLSIALVQAMEPQVLSDQTFYTKLCSDNFYSTPASAVKCDPNSANNTGTMIALLLLIGVMFIIVGYCFIVALGSLFGRMVSLFIAIVFAPLAFVSLIVPNMAHMPGFGWDEWFGNLMKNAFAAPIFFFFILLISILSKSTIIPADTSKLSAGVILLLVGIQFLILITMLLAAVKYVKSASGAIGSMMGGLAGTLVKGLGGLAVGTAAGTVALGGQKMLGGASTLLARSDKFTKWAGSEDKGLKGGLKRFAGEKVIKLGQAGSKASFDIRQNGAANAFSSATGMNLGSFGALSTKRTAGGFDAAVAYKAKKDNDFAESLSKNAKQDEALKGVKAKREGEVEALEREKELAQATRDTAKTQLETQEAIRKEALDTMNRVTDTGDARYIAAQKAFEDAEKQIKGERDAKGALVLGADGKPVNAGLRENAEDARLSVAKINNDILEKKTGEFVIDKDGKKVQKVVVEGETKADGTIATKADVAKGVISEKSLSTKDIDNLIESNKKANAKAYLYAQAKATGYHASAKYDKMGNTKSFHIDTSKKEGRQYGTAAARTFGETLLQGGIAGAIGLAVAGPLGLAVASSIGGISGFLKGADTGRSFKDAEAAHHTAEPHEGGAHGGHDAHGGYHPPSGGILSELTKLFGAASGGGGGGGHGGGGGGGGHH